MLRSRSQLAMVLVAACTFAPHSGALVVSPLWVFAGRDSSRAGCAGGAVSRFRAGLEDRPADVQRVRDASAGFLGEMLGAAAAEARRQRSRRAADAPMEREKRRVGILADRDSVAWDVARGLCRCGVQVVGGPGSHEGDQSLSGLVETMADNQAVIDASDVLILSLPPSPLPRALAPLAFQPHHLIISIHPTTTLTRVQSLAPGATVVRAAALPSVARSSASPLPLFPSDARASALFRDVAAVVETRTEEELEALAAAAALAAPLLRLQVSGDVGNPSTLKAAAQQWLRSHGVAAPSAARFVKQLLLSAADDPLPVDLLPRAGWRVGLGTPTMALPSPPESDDQRSSGNAAGGVEGAAEGAGAGLGDDGVFWARGWEVGLQKRLSLALARLRGG